MGVHLMENQSLGVKVYVSIPNTKFKLHMKYPQPTF